MRIYRFVAAAVASALLVHVGADPAPSSSGAVKEAEEAQEEEEEFDVDGTAGALAAGLAVFGAGGELSEKGAQAVEVISSTGALFSAFLPPPYNIVAMTGFATLGMLFGAKDTGPSNGDILGYLQEAFVEIGLKLDRIDQSIDRIQSSLDQVTRMTRYTSRVVSQIYKEIWMDPFQRIHASYVSLMTTYMPTSDGRSWDGFFETATRLRHELEAEKFDSFAVSNLREYLDWYEQYDNPDTGSKINDMGMCGVAFLFQYLMTVRSELHLISQFGSHTKIDNCNSGDKLCWKIDEDLSLAYASEYAAQLQEYDNEILNAQSRGGLGFAHLVEKSASELLEGVAPDGSELGFCFQCNGNGNECQSSFRRYPWPTPSNRARGNYAYGSRTPVESYQMCNVAKFTKTWYYYETVCPDPEEVEEGKFECAFDSSGDTAVNSGETCKYRCYECRGCPPPSRGYGGNNAIKDKEREQVRVNRQQNLEFAARKQNMACCSCACLSNGDYNYDIAGKARDHDVYARHCPADEMVYNPATKRWDTKDGEVRPRVFSRV